MKLWQGILLGVFFGLLAGAVIYLIIAPPRGEPITLIPPPTPAPLTVHIVGEVKNPGVYILPPRSRVSDAVDAAGGLLPSAVPESINLAAHLLDGQQIAILSKAQLTAAPIDLPQRAGDLAGGKVNLNTAGKEELLTLPGIGEDKAEKILAYRQEHGPFKTVDDILEVPGIGEGILENIKDLIIIGDAIP